MSDWDHTRVVGECSYPHDDPWIPACSACQDRLPAMDFRHRFLPDDCKFATTAPGSSGPRSSRRPHEVRPKAHTEATAAMAPNRDGVELGQVG